MNRLLLVLAVAVLLAAVSAKGFGGKFGKKGKKAGGKGQHGEDFGKGSDSMGSGSMGSGSGSMGSGSYGSDSKGSGSYGSDSVDSGEKGGKSDFDFSKKYNSTKVLAKLVQAVMNATQNNTEQDFGKVIADFVTGAANATSAKDILGALAKLGNGSRPISKMIQKVMHRVMKLGEFVTFAYIDKNNKCDNLNAVLGTFFNETLRNQTAQGKPSAIWAKYDMASVLATDMICIQKKLTAFNAAISTIGQTSTPQDIVASVARGLYAVSRAGNEGALLKMAIHFFVYGLKQEAASAEQQVALRRALTLKSLLAEMDL